MTAFLNARQMGDELGLKHSRVYELAQMGALPTVRLGRRVLFPKDGLEQLGKAAVERALEKQAQ